MKNGVDQQDDIMALVEIGTAFVKFPSEVDARRLKIKKFEGMMKTARN